MALLRPLFFMASLYAIGLSLIWTLLSSLHPAWWARAGVRRSFQWMTVLALVFPLLWIMGTLSKESLLARLGAFGAGFLTVALAMTALALLLAAGWRALWTRVLIPDQQEMPVAGPGARSAADPPGRSLARPEDEEAGSSTASPLPQVTPVGDLMETSSVKDLSRRDFFQRGIQASTSAIPLTALLSSGSGVVMAAQPRRLPQVAFYWPELPPDLDGLRILHLSDLHLGLFTHVDDVRRFLELAMAWAPDLIVFTGDVADDVAQLRPAMAAADACRPRLGVLASIGNHEYFRGIADVRRAYDAGPVPLLLSSGHQFQVGAATLYIGGADDPVRMNGRHLDFMARTIDRAFDGAPSDAFRLLLSHRPEGFVQASARGIDLVLSGHTHGGQLGHQGRSLLEPLTHERFLWGPYERGASRLYTSAGFGHWFPFRVGCPAEAPLIELRRGSQATQRILDSSDLPPTG